MKTNKPTWSTMKQVCERFQIKESMVRSMIFKGQIDHAIIRVGRLIRFDLDKIEEIFTGGKAPTEKKETKVATKKKYRTRKIREQEENDAMLSLYKLAYEQALRHVFKIDKNLKAGKEIATDHQDDEDLLVHQEKKKKALWAAFKGKQNE